MEKELQSREKLKMKSKLVIKIGTSTLSFESGRLNLQRIEKLVEYLCRIRQSGKKVVLVSSGAIGVGAGRLGMTEKPKDLSVKQALAAIGQAELIKIYQRFFDRWGQKVAQVLLTKDIVTDKEKNTNAKNTLDTLLNMEIIPIINENDTISIDEILFGDNDTLSANVATLIQAELLIMLSDIDGLFSDNPKDNPNAKKISYVGSITPKIEKLSNDTKSSFGTGGMATKILAAKICFESGIDSVITNGKDPSILFKVLNGENVGTLFSTNHIHNHGRIKY